MTATLDLGSGFSELIEQAVATALAARGATPAPPDDPLRWRSLLWSGDPALRLSVKELSLARGISRQSIYREVEQGLPCRRRHGSLVFLVGQVRAWLEREETVVNPVPLHLRPPR